MNPDPAPDTAHHASPARYITHDVPGIGGRLRDRPEDFLVDEIPLYAPCGQGEHIYMLVLKRGISTMEAIDVIARHFGVMRKAVGVAGLKDKHAITRQVFSVHAPGKSPSDFPFLEHEKVQILWTDLHTNKLRRGHLRGNRFSIRVRDVSPASVIQAQRVLKRLQAAGLPNRIGPQRFGLLANNHLVGRALILGDFQAACDLMLAPSSARPDLNPEARELYAQGLFAQAANAFPRNARAEQRALSILASGGTPRDAMLRIDAPVLGFFLSAFQSAVFNRVLDDRLAGHGISSLLRGDVAMKRENRACFDVDDAVLADPQTAGRLDSFDISPTGPLWGVGMKLANHEPAQAELAALQAFGVTPPGIAEWEKTRAGLIEGQRRPLRIPLIDPEVEGGVDEHGAYVRCAFELPRGSFATVVMAEVMKNDVSFGAEDPD